MRIALSQLNFHIGNFEANEKKILGAINRARGQKADLICFSELATCGYPPLDLLEFRDFIDQSSAVLDKVKNASEDIGILIGAPRVNPELPGKNLFNSAFLFYRKELLGYVDKSLLPTYDIFDEYRHFEPAKKFQTIDFKGERIAVTICEDIWDLINDDPIYTFHPMDKLMEQQPTVAINLSASPFHASQPQRRRYVVQANAKKYQIPFFYVNQVGAHTELIFDGGSLVVDADGEVHDEMPLFEESLRIYDLDEVHQLKGIGQIRTKDRIVLIHDALIMGIRDYFGKLGFKKAILGLSGGIDSALTAALTCRALGAENVHGLIMPSPFSSKHSVTDAKKLVENLGMTADTLSIDDLYEKFTTELSLFFEVDRWGVTQENIQARIRGILLMAYSNKMGCILLNTTNKSEMAVGYGTLYGDLCGGLSVLADVYKTDVYRLSAFMNREREIIPQNSIQKPPSAELRPDQKDSDSLPEYELLDQILYQYIEMQMSPSRITAMGFDKKTVQKILDLVNRSEFKRYQTAPVLRVSTKAFGSGRRMPIVSKYIS
nr:NAD+ synthase [Saprospiraceae bacterium]